MVFKKVVNLKGKITVPGDKSISHRSIMFGSLATGETIISGFLQADDCLATINAFRQMGVDIDNNFDKNIVTIKGKGLYGLKKPSSFLDVGNSGTTIRLMSGILSGQSFYSKITGDESIRSRPMLRIINPLLEMNAAISSENNNGCAPLIINASDLNRLKGIQYKSPVASAQIKSCILLAGLYADSETTVTEPALSRNHTELMLKAFGGKIHTKDNSTTVSPNPNLHGLKIHVPGDISSAAYFIAAGLLIPNSEILIKNVGINPTRDGIIEVCQNMGANIKLQNLKQNGGEAVADILVSSSNLNGVEISGDLIPRLIDEIPIIAVLAAFAKGQTIIRDAAELKVKESNRIDTMVENLSKMGADIMATDDGMIINGQKSLHGATIDSKFDHRIAMSFAIAGLLADGETIINGFESVNISYPDFYKDLTSLI